MSASADTRDQPGAAKLAWLLALVLAVTLVVLYLAVGALRLDYPYALEWLEGASVDHVVRVAAGEPLYRAPSIDFVPFIYTPLYYWVAAAPTLALGPGFLPLRLVSYASSIGCLWLIFLLVREATGRPRAGAIAAGLYAGCFQISGAWFDTGRMDSLLLLLILSTVWLLRRPESVLGQLAAGGTLALAYFTKQAALIVALPLCLHAIVTGRGSLRLAFPLAFGALVGLGILVGQLASDGWFGFYTLTAPAAHFDLSDPGQAEIWRRMFLGFWTRDLLASLPIATLVGLGGLWISWALGSTDERRDALFWIALAAGMLATSWSQRLHLGGFLNVLMPAYALLSLLTGLALARPVEHLAGRLQGARGWLMPVVLLAVCAQFAALLYDPRDELPTDADRRASERLIDVMTHFEEPIWAPSHGYLPRVAGVAPHAHTIPLHDVLRAQGPVAESLREEVDRALRERRFSAIVTPVVGFDAALMNNYERRAVGGVDPDVTYPRGARIARSQDVFLRRPMTN